MIRTVFLILLLGAGQVNAQQLRLLTYNIHHARNESGIVDVATLAGYIQQQQPDVVALQEVDSMCNRSGRIDMMKQLGMLTGMYYYFGKAMDYDGGGYGEGLLSRHPIEQLNTLALPIQAGKGREPRAAIEAIVSPLAGKRFKLIATHLDHLEDDTDRLLQTQFIAQWLKNEPLPFVVAGDLNAIPNSKAMEPLWPLLSQPALDKNQPTWPSVNPRSKIDYILFSKNDYWNCTRFEVLPEDHISDHRPVVAEITW